MVRQLQSQHFLDMTLIISLLILSGVGTLTESETLRSDCPDKCGNIIIPYPFGIGTGCYRNGFNITCNTSTGTPRAFLGSEPASSIEVIDINITTSEARVYNEIGYRCYNHQNITYRNNSGTMDITAYDPYVFSDKRNKFTVIGCDTFVGINDIPYQYSACSTYCYNSTDGLTDGDSCDDSLGCCQTPILPGLYYYSVTWANNNNTAWWFNPCQYAMLLEEDWYKFHVLDLSKDDFLQRNKKGVPVVFDWAITDGMCQEDGIENSSNHACLSNHSSCYNVSNLGDYL